MPSELSRLTIAAFTAASLSVSAPVRAEEPESRDLQPSELASACGGQTRGSVLLNARETPAGPLFDVANCYFGIVIQDQTCAQIARFLQWTTPRENGNTMHSNNANAARMALEDCPRF